MTTNTINTLADIKAWQDRMREAETDDEGEDPQRPVSSFNLALAEIVALRAYAEKQDIKCTLYEASLEKADRRIAELEAIEGRYNMLCGEYGALMAKYSILSDKLAASQVEAEPVGAGNYVQPVPNHCDRIMWRGSYYGLPFAAQPTAPAGDKAVLSRCDAGTTDALKHFELVQHGADSAWLILRANPELGLGSHTIRFDGEEARNLVKRFGIINAAIAAAQVKENDRG